MADTKPEGKYGEYITSTSFINPKDPIEGSQAAWLAGGGLTPHLKSLNLTIMYASYKQPGPMGFIPNGAHVHPFDEVQLFIGTEPNDVSKLGGEVEIALGAEEEKHIISCPTAIAIPKGLPHLPATIKRVYHPFIFMTVSLNQGVQFTRVP